MPEKRKDLYLAELERLMWLLPKTEPGSEEYSRIFYVMGDIEYRLERLDAQLEVNAVAPTETPTEPLVTEPDTSPVVDTDDIKDGAEYINPEDLRASLADAKKKGVNISELISSLGAPNFSGLRDDQNKLRQLKTMMENALKEIA